MAAQARAAIETGVFDGVMLDWWQDDDARLEMIEKIRQAIGDKALILANANDRKTPRTASYINGYFMECWRSKTPEDWKRIADTLIWAEHNLRQPRVNCLETRYHNSRDDLHLMRATTTLSLALSDGYCLFSDPNALSTPDHLHNWYPFWNKSLGRPVSPGMERDDGAFVREFNNGAVVYNPMGNNVATVRFPERRTSMTSGKRAEEHSVNPGDGDIFLRDQSM